MRSYLLPAITGLVVLSLLAACSPAAPTAAPTKPSAPAAPTAVPPPPSAATAAPAAATKPAAAAPTAPTAAPAAKIKRGGTLKLSQDKEIASLDPHMAVTGGVYHTSLLYDGLLAFKFNEQTKGFDNAPELATEWKYENPTTLVFKLRKGVKFHDGSDFNANVAAWNFDRMINKPKSMLKLNAFAQATKSVEVVDDYTLKFNLKYASAPFLVDITPPYNQGAYMISQKAAESTGDDAFGRNPVGSGAMKFVDWKTADLTRLAKFDGYWDMGEDGKPLPYLDAAESRQISDKTVQTIEMKTGRIDYMENPLAKDYATLKSDPNVVVKDAPWTGCNFNLILNMQRPPFNNKTLRQGVQYAIDREAVAKVVGLDAQKASYYHWRPGQVGYDDTLPRYTYDLNKAKQLIKDTGLATPIKALMTQSNVSAHVMIGEALQFQLKQAGFDIQMDKMEDTAWRNTYGSGQYDLFTLKLCLRNPDPDWYSTRFVTGANQWGYSNPESDKCMEEGRKELDEKKRGEIYKRCQKIIWEDAVEYPVWFDQRTDLISKRVRGYVNQPGGWVLKYVWLDD